MPIHTDDICPPGFNFHEAESFLSGDVVCYKSSMCQLHCVHTFGMHSNSMLTIFFCIRKQFRGDTVLKADLSSQYTEGALKKLYKCSMLRALNFIYIDNFYLLCWAPSTRNSKEMYEVYPELLLYFQG